MQPYFFPYIGYFQLISAVDVFVVYDDVQYIKNGWINRNRILLNNAASYITLPVERGHLGDTIRQRHFVGYEQASRRVFNQVAAAYRKAPFFAEVTPLLEFLLGLQGENIASTLGLQLKELSKFLGIPAEFRICSEVLANNGGATGQDRVIGLCRAMQATEYYNTMGGTALYDPTTFARHEIKLFFVRPRPAEYQQYQSPFVGNLSIIDVLMFNPRERVNAMIKEWDAV